MDAKECVIWEHAGNARKSWIKSADVEKRRGRLNVLKQVNLNNFKFNINFFFFKRKRNFFVRKSVQKKEILWYAYMYGGMLSSSKQKRF
jgi:hypothetical protein